MVKEATKANPSPTEDDGRDKKGRFKPGNKHGKGHPFHKRVAQLRSAMLNSVTPEDIGEVVEKLLTQAKAGDAVSIKILLDHCVGKPVPASETNGGAAIELPPMRCAEDTVMASNQILEGLASGQLEPDIAARMASLVGLAVKAIEVAQLEARIAALEKGMEQ